MNPQMNDQVNVGINGKTYEFGWTQSKSPNTFPNTAMGVDLNAGYTTFTARLGLLSTSQTGEAKIAVLLDGKIAADSDVAVKQSKDVTIDVTKAQRLEITIYPPKGNGNSVIFAVGDPKIS